MTLERFAVAIHMGGRHSRGATSRSTALARVHAPAVYLVDLIDVSAQSGAARSVASEIGLRTFCGLNSNHSRKEQLSHFAKPLERALVAVEKLRLSFSVRISEPWSVVRGVELRPAVRPKS